MDTELYSFCWLSFANDAVEGLSINIDLIMNYGKPFL